MKEHVSLQAATVVGTAQEGFWAQSYVHEPILGEEKAARGILYCVIDLSGSSDLDVSAIGKAILTEIERTYFGKLEGSILNALEDAMVVAFQKLQSAAISSSGGVSGIEFNCIVCASWGKIIYFVQLGEGKVDIWRDGKLRLLLPSQKKKEKDGVLFESISGFVKDKDVFIFGSPAFFTLVPSEKVTKLLDHKTARDVAGDLAPLVFGSEKSAAAAAMLLSVSQETVPTDEEAIEFIDPDQKQPEEEKEEFRQEETSVADVGDTREGIAQDGINPPVKEKLQGIFMKVKNRLLSYVSRVSLPSLPIPGRSSTLYIHRPQDTVSNKSKRFLWIAVVFFLILGISVFWGILRKQTDEKRAEFTSLYESAQTKYEEGAGLLDINVKTARASLLQAKEKLFEAEKLQVEKKKVEELKNMIEEKLVIARREYAPTLETFLPLSLVKDQAKGTSLALFEKKLVILDATNALLYQVDVETKQADIVGGGKDVLSDAVAVAFHGNRAYVLSRTSGIIRFETSSGERLVFEKETVWEDLVDVYAYAGNLYVLDRNGSKVWVYKSSSETKTGFSGIQSWFSQGESYDLSGSIRLSIDGAIWVLFEDGTIERFLSGTKQAYQLSNLEENPLMSASDLFVNEETTFVYVLDKDQGRIVVYVKNTGEYHSQYKAEALKNVKDFIVLEQGKKVIVLTETSLETFDLLLP